MGIGDYLPAGGTTLFYITSSTLFDDFTGSRYKVLASPPVPMETSATLTWFGGALWSYTEGTIISYDLTSNTWTTDPLGGGADAGYSRGGQTTNDNVGNIWAFFDTSTLLEYNIGTASTTFHTLSTSVYSFDAALLAYDGCSSLLYLTSQYSSTFHSYDPTTGTEATLTSLPDFQEFESGFCSDRSGHIFAVTNSFEEGGERTRVFQYTITTDTWQELPGSGGPDTTDSPACGVGSDGYLYVAGAYAPSVYRILLN
jgi:hypothetical protein